MRKKTLSSRANAAHCRSGMNRLLNKPKKQLEIRSKGRQIIEEEDDYQLRDRQVRYGEGIHN